MLAKVFLLKEWENLAAATKKLLADIYSPKANLLIKIHFGEPGNQTALWPQDVEPIIRALKFLQINAIFIDTPVAYHSPRKTVSGYQKAVKKKGWDELGSITIGNQFRKVKIKDLTVEVCQTLIEADNVLVISHVKGHPCAGFGGAIKNLGMGGVSPKTKKEIHQGSKPYLTGECRGCGTCVQLCPARAITMINNQACFNLDVCWGCSICQLECPNKCLAPKKAAFDDLLAQGAAAVINHLPQKTFYINLMKNITQRCDCEVDPGPIIAQDVGILFSQNPVAIDHASIDLIRKKSGKKVFQAVNHKNPLLQINFAAKYTQWSSAYQLIKI